MSKLNNLSCTHHKAFVVSSDTFQISRLLLPPQSCSLNTRLLHMALSWWKSCLLAHDPITYGFTSKLNSLQYGHDTTVLQHYSVQGPVPKHKLRSTIQTCSIITNANVNDSTAHYHACACNDSLHFQLIHEHRHGSRHLYKYIHIQVART